MDVFSLRERLIKEHSDYVQSFIRIADERIRATVDGALADGLLWPDPLISLNPSFEPGPWIAELVNDGVLHPTCGTIFRVRPPDGPPRPLRLHRHQAEALRAARAGDHYILTTGTGSGKSLTYIVPIVDHILRHGSGRGIQAIVVYPMNALANSQVGELQKFIGDTGAVTFQRYTGQESAAEKQAIINRPPDILLTNFVMLELLLTRPHERAVVAAAAGLRFLVLDELHTYRGRQGADVAMLVRRLRLATSSPDLQCVGTSATLAGGASLSDQPAQIAAVATRIFGATVKPERVIGETLARATPERDWTDPLQVADLRRRVAQAGKAMPGDAAAFQANPLASWIETTFGPTRDSDGGRLRRSSPRSISGTGGAADELAALTGQDPETCREAIEALLLAGYRVTQPETGFPIFAFRLHQLIGRGDTVYTSLEPPDQRHITLQPQEFVPGDRHRILLPLAFCRDCGQPYYTVRQVRDPATGHRHHLPRPVNMVHVDQGERAGFLYLNPDDPWPKDPADQRERLPEDWIEPTGGGLDWRVKREVLREGKLPERLRVNPRGEVLDGGQIDDGLTVHFVPAPLAFCLHCGVTYSGRTGDFARLASLSSEGRSTATTVLALAAIRALQDDPDLPTTARKLLSFTDNRQDASLQAGHFNDFVEVALVRAALYRAVRQAGEDGLEQHALAGAVFAALDLPLELYAADPNVRFGMLDNTKAALREVLGYRVFRDLRRGWRVTQPNLEQCGLLEIRYPNLDPLCAAESEWVDRHPALAAATPEQRHAVARVLLDYLRRELAIRVDYLDEAHQDQIRQRSTQRLVPPWSLDEAATLEHAAVAYPRSRRPNDYRGHVYVSPRGRFGQYLRRTSTFPDQAVPRNLEETDRIIRDLFAVLQIGGLVHVVAPAGPDGGDTDGYQVSADAMWWVAGSGTPRPDPIQVPRAGAVGPAANPFFRRLYEETAMALQGVAAREHTAQVDAALRQEREARFREGALAVLFCSPTMELGVDIAELNVVNLRNVPPTPANYAQRSGRAGRSGQPALVFTYCTTGSPHDQYFFRRREQMVAGAVTPPRLDLANEDLIRSHVHAVWLAESGLDLGETLKEVLEVEGEAPTLEVKPHARAALQDRATRERVVLALSPLFRDLAGELAGADWYDDGWPERVLADVEDAFEQACARWRSLYRAALRQQDIQNRIRIDPTRSRVDREEAQRLRREAEAQLQMLTEGVSLAQSDFYSYRYLASEGFLPGYSFPRLPLSAFIPGRRRVRGEGDDYVSRARFLAISEFGPQSIIYHEGTRYVVNRVILPPDDELRLASAKLCPACGFLHPADAGGLLPDVCARCGRALDGELRRLLPLQNVSTKARARINSDEEERVRMGYELRTAVRLAVGAEAGHSREAVAVLPDGREVLRLSYGQAATLWRINLGWRRRREPQVHGFVLDVERGYWAGNELDPESDPEAPLSARRERVIPFVQDHRNCLLIEPAGEPALEEMASLQPALKLGIQVRFQLEDSELAVEALPTPDNRRLILLYEAAEGGAGVLRQLLDQPAALAEVAREALALCHFDPASGADRRRSERASEDCEAACYDCLMSYANQPDHHLLDRQRVLPILMDLARARLEVRHAGGSGGPGGGGDSAGRSVRPGGDGDAGASAGGRVIEAAGTAGHAWLDWLTRGGYRLPDGGALAVAACGVTADFVYRQEGVTVLVDPDGRVPAAAEDCLTDRGYIVLRFGDPAGWEALVRRNAYLFGPGRRGG